MSTDHQRYSIENQATAIATHAKVHQLSIVQTYRDKRENGLKIKNRPGLIQLIEDVQSGTKLQHSSAQSIDEGLGNTEHRPPLLKAQRQTAPRGMKTRFARASPAASNQLSGDLATALGRMLPFGCKR
jgi:hypothetical protein